MRPSALVPAPVLRAVDGARTRRFLATTAPATESFVERYGLTVRGGPFTGMHYLEGLEQTSGDLVAKLTGSYERELHPAIGQWITDQPLHVVDVGCAEGYYAVGLARAMPQAHVHAYDIDRRARSRCVELARLNGVEERVEMHGECVPESLSELPDGGVVVLSDCEGAERSVLDPQRAPRLSGWSMIVELHDFIDPTISQTIVERFAPTHEVEIVAGVARDPREVAEVAFMTPRQQEAVLSERRPGPMQWAVMRPRT